MKRLLIIFSVFSIVLSSLGFTVSADEVQYKWELVDTYTAQTLYDNYSSEYAMTLENGVVTVTTRWWSCVPMFTNLDTSSTYLCVLDSESNGLLSYSKDGSNIYGATFAGSLEITGAMTIAFFRSNDTPKSTNFRYANLYKKVPSVPFGTGGLAGDSSDLSYASSFLSHIFQSLWNLIIQYWWLLALVILPVAYWIITIFIDFIFKSRFKNGKRGYGIFGIFKSFRDRIDEKRREKYANKIFGMRNGNDQLDYVKIDGHIYYNPKHNVKNNARVEFGKFRKNVIYADVYKNKKRDYNSVGKE